MPSTQTTSKQHQPPSSQSWRSQRGSEGSISTVLASRSPRQSGSVTLLPTAVATPGHNPQFKVDCLEEWVLEKAYKPLPHQPFEGFDFFFGQDEPLYDNTFNGELTES
ncbi:hypothetical protein DFP72DRAFT_1049491 [Ephemerocybe angulata]|uniref:Uncharacterized protein n=1 Tax=Ephemerocybe angulata TaxID=980116 RepID=A0A8H6M174_9AGAR|nr:hypothetical protein DFP72DRAFT_1049491 [Tulosesus angulatus]